MGEMFINRAYTAFIGSTPLVSPNGTGAAASNQPTNGEDFNHVLQQAIAQQTTTDIVFSKHAMQRISDRGIDVSPQMLQKVTNAVERAEAKGITDALILGPQAAFIVNIPSKTVITTMGTMDMQDHVITNIDGTVMI